MIEEFRKIAENKNFFYDLAKEDRKNVENEVFQYQIQNFVVLVSDNEIVGIVNTDDCSVLFTIPNWVVKKIIKNLVK